MGSTLQVRIERNEKIPQTCHMASASPDLYQKFPHHAGPKQDYQVTTHHLILNPYHILTT